MTQPLPLVPDGGIAACPVCRQPLGLAAREMWCDNGHRFDRAKEGFVNLLRVGKGRKAVIGDDADMVASRRAFLERGHYRVLSEGLRTFVAELHAEEPVGSLLDVGCGEGSFTAAMLDGLGDEDRDPRSLLAFDISRPAVRVTAKRVPQGLSAVASVIDMPVLDHSVELLASVMSPLHEAEFTRVARPGGRALVVRPGSSHLNQLRSLVYGSSAQPHDELFDAPTGWEVLEQRRFTSQIQLTSSDEVMQVWGMTPYRWNSPREGGARVEATSSLELDVHFVATVLRVP